jgi:hypothetical protein
MSTTTDSNFERTQVHRLFYVENDRSCNDEIFKIAGDLEGISEASKALHQLDLHHVELFGIYGDREALKTYLNSLFPNADSQIQRCFDDQDPMPIIWIIHNSKKFVFSLISHDDQTTILSNKASYFTVVMQRFLQDICPKILICPSESFFTNFSSEHSFHGRPHGQRTYRQVKTTLIDVQAAQRIQLEDRDNLKLLFGDHCRHVLTSGISPNTFCMHHKLEEDNRSTTNKFQNLKESFQKKIVNLDTLTLRSILDICQQCQIQVSRDQEDRINQTITTQLRAYQNEKSTIENHGKSLIKGLLGIEDHAFNFSSSGIQISKEVRKQLYLETTKWLIDPVIVNETAQEFADRTIQTIHQHQNRSQNKPNIVIKEHQKDYFISQLQSFDRKSQMRKLREQLIEMIYLAFQSENQFDVCYNLYQLSYVPVNPEQTLSDLTIKCTGPNEISFSSLAELMNILDLSESDRRTFSDRIEFLACFKTYDGFGNILVLRRPNILNKAIDPVFGLSILFLKNGILRKVTDYYLPKIHVAYACNSTSQTLLLYNIGTGAVTKCMLNDFGQRVKSDILQMENGTKKPMGIKSLALTIAQDLLILIDSSSNIYSMDLSRENATSIELLCKSKDRSTYESNFVADNGEFYNHVQTIGEKSPIFFFQSYSCVDIIDQNYHQIQSIQLDTHYASYRMQIFTDFLTTYCILFNSQQYEVYAVQNLISDTRIERQKSLNDLQKSNNQYIGNRLLDIIKQGEVQFGPPDSLEKTQYYFILSPEKAIFYDRIQRYFRELTLFAELHADDNIPKLLIRSRDAFQLSQLISSRVPLQLCTIEMSTLIPLNNGRRDRMDHLSSKSFRIEMKAREISFSYLDQILNDIDHNLPIVGVIGRQSTGKSYLMNRIFGTRFAVAAGRCTDGIWMSYACHDDQHFLVLDCEGLFSDQRTDDEEIKLISFLAAICDVTILSQDLGFSRFQDRLFGVLSQAVEKIGKNEKLFQGSLLIAVRDISDSNSTESFDAAEKKFIDLQKRGRSGFLEQLFSNTFTIQLLHHFENMNFNHEIAKLRDSFVGLNGNHRWENGKELADRMKILLVQLYTDDFLDSNEIHTQMKLSELEEEMKQAWTRFNLENVEEQTIEKVFQDKNYHFKLNHENLQLDEQFSENNFEQLRQFLLQPLGLRDETKEENNRMLGFLDSIIPEVMIYRRQQVKRSVIKSFQKTFPEENDLIREKRTKFLDTMEQYMVSFKLQMCLKKCSMCDLKCLKNAQHTEETKNLLEKKKEQWEELQSLMKTKISDDERDKLNQEIIEVKNRENELHKEKVRLEHELKYLLGKEDLFSQINQYKSQLDTKQNEIDDLQTKIDQMEKRLKEIIPTANETSKIYQVIQDEIKNLFNRQLYQSDQQQKLMKKFYREDPKIDTELIRFNDRIESEELNNLIASMNTNFTCVTNCRIDVESYLKMIVEGLINEKNQLAELNNSINDLEHQLNQTKTNNEQRKTLINQRIEEKEDLQRQLLKMDTEKNTLEKKIQEENQKILSDQEKIQQYIERLEIELTRNAGADVSNLSSEADELTLARQLIKDLHTFEDKIPMIEKQLTSFRKIKSSKEQLIQQYKEADLSTEDEERSLMNMNTNIEEKEAEFNDLLAKKSAMYNENQLLKKILNQSPSNLEQQTHFDQVCHSIKNLNERATQISNELISLDNQCNEDNQAISTLTVTLQTKQTDEEKIQQTVQNQTEWHQIGTEFHQSLINTEDQFNRSLKRLNELIEVESLIKDHRSLSDTLKSTEEQMTDLQTKYHQLIQEFNLMDNNVRDCSYSYSKDCEVHYKKIEKNYQNAHQKTEQLELALAELDNYSHLKSEITQLEREAQRNCTCGTDHKCSGICEICPMEGQLAAKPCMFSAGHSGQHKCDAGHVCQHSCQICQLRGDPPNRCHFPYEHQSPEYHQCERAHQCPKTCVCSEPCAIPLQFQGHDVHRCDSEVCWKPCMFSCGKRCVTKDHSHDAKVENVIFAIGRENLTMKKHLCDQSHYCPAICDAPGVCKQEYKTQQKAWRTESGEEFQYEHIEVKEIRGKCGIQIPASQHSHDQINKEHRCDGLHTCQERCPDCNSFCRQPHGHKGFHYTLHRNKDQHVFTSTNPLDQIEIRSNYFNEGGIRKYKIGESAQPENCTISCKRRDRGHFHLVECPGGNNCHQVKLGTKAKHCDEVYYYGPDQPSPKKYDQILCATYWSQYKWLSPVNDVDRKLIDSCNFFCTKHVERDRNNQIIKDSSKGFCTLDAWHTGSHTFECVNEHQNMETYQGIDVCFVIDTTSSMGKYIEQVKSTITRIIEENEEQLKRIKASSTFQFAIVDYRDHPPEGNYLFRQCEFTNHRAAIEYVQKLTANSGGDTPEAVLDGLDAACSLKWRDKADHLVFHVLDAPPHGRTYSACENDRWPEGCPCGRTAESVLPNMKKKNIVYNVLLCSKLLNMMIGEFKKYIEVETLVFGEEISFEAIIARQVHQQLTDTEMTVKKTLV